MNTIKTSTLRPGLLVSLSIRVTGNVKYDKRDIERDHATGDGKRKAKWETERTIADPVEFEAASKVRYNIRSLITRICSASAFGLLCPETAADELGKAITQARAEAEDFNGTAKLTRVSVYVIAGRIAADDLEAVRAINSEVRELLLDMENGLKNLDSKVVREAANKAKDLGQMLSPEAAKRIEDAIDAARFAARKIVKAGEQGAVEIDSFAIRTITESRMAFLDLDEAKEVAAPSVAGRSIDLIPTNSIGQVKAQVSSFEME